MKKNIYLLLLVIITCSCKYSSKHEIKSVAYDFTNALYNFRYKEAKQLVTEESCLTLVFYSSNIHQSDLDLYKKFGRPKIKVENVNLNSENDEDAIAYVDVKNFIKLNLISNTSSVIKEKKIKLHLKKIQGEWIVDLKSPV
jgi:hypothetical protein